jgi:hypothetical protein
MEHDRAGGAYRASSAAKRTRGATCGGFAAAYPLPYDTRKDADQEKGATGGNARGGRNLRSGLDSLGAGRAATARAES